jgi:hypothetical protein
MQVVAVAVAGAHRLRAMAALAEAAVALQGQQHRAQVDPMVVVLVLQARQAVVVA